MKRRRLLGKQPPPPCDSEDSRLADDSAVPAAEPAAESDRAAAVVALPEAASPEPDMAGVETVDGTADAAPRWHVLGKYKTVHALVSAVVRDKSDEQLESLSVTVLLQDILAKSNGQITMAQLMEEKDQFISATMSAVPKELSRRQLASMNMPKLASRPATIDAGCVQKTYLLTFSNMDAATAPTRQGMLDVILQAFHSADYGSDASVTHACVFREPHSSGQWHFHVAVALSVPCRWSGWKKELVKAGFRPHFANMPVDDHSQHRRMQYAHMLRYLWLPSDKKDLSALDKEPLLWCSGGKKHPPLLDGPWTVLQLKKRWQSVSCTVGLQASVGRANSRTWSYGR